MPQSSVRSLTDDKRRKNPAPDDRRVSVWAGATLGIRKCLAALFDDSLNENKVVRSSSLEHRAVIRGDRYILERPENDGRAEVYRISHDGAKTLFEKMDESEYISDEFDLYEDFQDSFIRNYSHYKDLVWEGRR